MPGGDVALADLLAQGGVARELAERLSAYGARLLEANRHFNLSGADTAEELAPHLLDSLTLLPYVRGPLIDVGSGGGLPAVPLALVTGMEVTLVEATAKKAAFLQSVLSGLGLPGRVVAQRAEVAGRDPDLRERFASATARAVASAPAVLELATPFLAIGGITILQRGRLDARERNAVIDAAPMLGARLTEEVQLEGERRILIVEKEHPTPGRFPRRPGVPARRPLCY